MEHVRFIVNNTYICNDRSNIKKQTVGIPMGTNASPGLANLTLYTDESEYVDNLIRKSRTTKLWSISIS